MFRTIALTGLAALMAATAISLAPPAQAQIGNIFSDPPPRPPGNVPRGEQQQQQVPDDDEEVPELPRGRLLPTPEPSAAGAGRAAAGKRPVATAGAAARYHRRAAGHPAGHRGCSRRSPASRASRARRVAPGQRQPKGVPQTPATLQPGDEVVSEPPPTKSPTRRRASQASTRSPAASSISTRISARPCSSVRCG